MSSSGMRPAPVAGCVYACIHVVQWYASGAVGTRHISYTDICICTRHISVYATYIVYQYMYRYTIYIGIYVTNCIPIYVSVYDIYRYMRHISCTDICIGVRPAPESKSARPGGQVFRKQRPWGKQSKQTGSYVNKQAASRGALQRPPAGRVKRGLHSPPGRLCAPAGPIGPAVRGKAAAQGRRPRPPARRTRPSPQAAAQGRQVSRACLQHRYLPGAGPGSGTSGPAGPAAQARPTLGSLRSSRSRSLAASRLQSPRGLRATVSSQPHPAIGFRVGFNIQL